MSISPALLPPLRLNSYYMADEAEVLDWDEDDAQTPFVAADDEDAVSLGASDDELDEPDDAPAAKEDIPSPPPSSKPAVVERASSKRHSSPPRHEHNSRSRGDRDRDRDRERHRDSRDSRNDRDRERDRDRDAPRERKPHKIAVSQPITHALPPKPVTTVPAFMHPSHPSSIEATLMAPSALKDAKDSSVSRFPRLPIEVALLYVFASFSTCVASVVSCFLLRPLVYLPSNPSSRNRNQARLQAKE